MPPAVVLEAVAGQHAGVLERGEHLGYRRRRDGRATCELGADDLSVRYRLHGQILSDRERRVVRSEHALDPAADERGGTSEPLRRLASRGMVTGAWH